MQSTLFGAPAATNGFRFRLTEPCLNSACEVMSKVIWIHALPKFPRVGSLLNALKCPMWISCRNVSEGEIDFGIIERVFKNEIYSDHRSFLSEN
jgi:hypothetical protein